MNIHPIGDTHQHHDFVYFVRSTSDAVIPESPDDQWKWLTKEDVEALSGDILTEIKEYCLEALKLAHEQD